MLDQYLIENLLIGNLTINHSVGGTFGVTKTTNGPFIFCKVPTEEGKKQKLKEIFTEEVYKLSVNPEKEKFGKTYVEAINLDIKSFLTPEEISNGSVSKARLRDIYRLVVTSDYEVSKQKTR